MVRMRGVWQRQTCGHGICGVVWLLLILLPALGHAEQFTGTVVGISDGDTLNVLRGGKRSRSGCMAWTRRKRRRPSAPAPNSSPVSWRLATR